MSAPAESAVPLRRNRDVVLLQAGELLSSAGPQSTTIVYSLLALALTGSPAKAGVVGFARSAPIGVVALVAGAGFAFFAPAASGALRSVVPPHQLGDAAGAERARLATVRLAGPPLGGALYGLGRAVPFAVDAASYVCSLASVLLMRTPFQEVREPVAEPLRTRVAAGLRFVWGQPFLRIVGLLFALLNAVGPGLLLALVVVGRRQALSGAAIGALVGAFGAAMLLGSLVSPLARRRLPAGVILVLELWTWPLAGAFAVWPSVYVLAAAMIPCGFAIPITDSAVVGYRLAITPDRLVGRVVSAHGAIVMAGGPLGTLGAGVLLDALAPRVAIGLLAGVALGVAVWGTASPSLRAVPRVADVERPGAPG